MNLSFGNPAYLWYLLSVPLLIITHFVLLKHTKSKAMKFANFEALRRVSSEGILTKNYTLLITRVLMLTLLIFAIADATLWYEGKASLNTYIIAIDVSASMAAQDLQPTRLETAKEYARMFVTDSKAQATFGVISFSGIPFIAQTPTTDKQPVLNAINQLEVVNAGGTDLAGAIITATNLLATSSGGKAIILLTDGSTTAGYLDDDPVLVSTRYAVQNNVRVHTIGVGELGGPIGYLPEFYNITSAYQEDDLKYIANKTGGMYYHAKTAEDIRHAYEELDTESKLTMLNVKLGPLLLLAGLLLLFLEWGLVNTRFKRVP
ncbi:MAG: VWA domain-containing protein [archaeon]